MATSNEQHEGGAAETNASGPVPGHNADRGFGAGSGVDQARATVHRMVWPGGCAWHEVQTHESLVPFLIEETAEFVDAVERGLPADEIAEELGDVLYQVLFHAAIAERDLEGYDLDLVGARLSEKLRARHPHVFGDRGYMSVEQLHAEWERLKEDAVGERRGSRGALDGIPAGMPTLARSAKVVERLKRAGLLDPGFSDRTVLPDHSADLEQRSDSPAGAEAPGRPCGCARDDDESDDAVLDLARGDRAPTTEEELGDAILALIIRANGAGLDPDRALRLATSRLTDRLLGSDDDATG
jgi:NTP pyrophosphatase (non-canonical NTP hydrolase)